MVQMEVDMLSPTCAFHPMSKFNPSSKRPRPTDEDSPSSRPIVGLSWKLVLATSLHPFLTETPDSCFGRGTSFTVFEFTPWQWQ